MEKLFLACDGGGTKAEFVVIQNNGTVLKQLKIPGNNPNFGGMEKTEEAMVSGINTCLKEFPNIKSIFIGNAGLSVGDNRKILNSFLKEKFPDKDIECDTDLMNLINLSTCKFSLILGTGIVIAVKNGEGFIRYGGLGHLLDKGGSAYHIGRDAIESGLIDDKNLLPGDSKNAAYAVDVINSYKNGNKIAEKILEKNAKNVADLILEAMEKEGKQKFIFVSGGLVEHFGDIYLPLIKKYINIEFITLKLPQIFGASKRCVRLFGNLEDDFETNFINSYKEA